MLNKVTRTSLADQTYAEMERMIESGTWLLGSRIPSETALMEQLGVSRNTLREAVRAMVHVGLLETKQGDGTFVVATSELNAILRKRIRHSTVLETMEVRHALDRQAVALACLNRTDEDLAELRRCRDLCTASFREQSLERFVKADWQLHRAIVASAHNALMADIYANLFEEIQLSIASSTEFGSDSLVGHPGLLEAIEARNAGRAVAEVDAYIAVNKSLVRDLTRSADVSAAEND
ncbi:DNA-binding transcriptional regulator, FadR family [Paenibacillus sp. UNC496MF]|uniref:FadR/GntR family transcriptional regulator n=1 Tax=Paenibacillus sp. UNC496MF TaxID=1502753 RepID=UPI0008E9A077|nr:FCD domain-containing protein [Paenibacillus sp. UNC496MF]SFI36648.1 DNA-binding transcriptional regulator, FadR family [Paenibacillus sp. UNC496MF]